MCKAINQYADKIKGQFSFFNQMIINGYFRPLLSEQTRISYLYSMGIPLRDFTGYFIWIRNSGAYSSRSRHDSLSISKST